MTLRTEKFEELIRRAAATFLERESNGDAMISVTHVSVTPDLRQAKVFLSVFPADKEAAVLHFAMRNGGEMRGYLKEHLSTKTIPFVTFEIDLGEKARQKIDDLLR